MNNSEYISRDLGEVTALVTLGCPFRSINWKDDVAYFSFANRTRCEAFHEEYAFGQLTVPARAYFDNLRMIKRQLYTNSRTARVVKSL
jgi:hypothetical protein